MAVWILVRVRRGIGDSSWYGVPKLTGSTIHLRSVARNSDN
jgi:hypothetical protein